jgi:hypothetical protein
MLIIRQDSEVARAVPMLTIPRPAIPDSGTTRLLEWHNAREEDYQPSALLRVNSLLKIMPGRMSIEPEPESDSESGPVEKKKKRGGKNHIYKGKRKLFEPAPAPTKPAKVNIFAVFEDYDAPLRRNQSMQQLLQPIPNQDVEDASDDDDEGLMMGNAESGMFAPVSMPNIQPPQRRRAAFQPARVRTTQALIDLRDRRNRQARQPSQVPASQTVPAPAIEAPVTQPSNKLQSSNECRPVSGTLSPNTTGLSIKQCFWVTLMIIGCLILGGIIGFLISGGIWYMGALATHLTSSLRSTVLFPTTPLSMYRKLSTPPSVSSLALSQSLSRRSTSTPVVSILR